MPRLKRNARVPTDASTVDTFALMLANRRDAMARAAETPDDDDENNRATRNWLAADAALIELVTLIAGPAPSAIRLGDGTIVAAGIDEMDDAPDARPRLFVIPAGSVVDVAGPPSKFVWAEGDVEVTPPAPSKS